MKISDFQAWLEHRLEAARRQAESLQPSLDNQSSAQATLERAERPAIALAVLHEYLDATP